VPNVTQITPPRVAIIDENTGYVSREWYRYFYNLYYATGGTTGGAIPVDRGGTGTTQVPTDGQILVGFGAEGRYNVTDLDTGPGIASTTGPGTLSIENTGVLSNIAGDGIEVDQATGDVTITNTGVLSNIAGLGISVDQPTGDVTITNEGVLSIIAGDGILVDQPTGDVTVTNNGVLSFSGGTTGLTPATATIGAITLGGTLAVANGGTGQTSYTNGQLLIGNSTGNTLTKATLTAGTGISITNGAGSITIAASGTSTADQENQTATAGQTVFTLTTMTYVPGSNTLSVFIDGINQQLTTAYAETNSTTVTFTAGLHVGAKVRFATS